MVFDVIPGKVGKPGKCAGFISGFRLLVLSDFCGEKRSEKDKIERRNERKEIKKINETMRELEESTLI